MNIRILSIPHKQQRYETVGDYFRADGQLQVRVSKMSNWRYEACVLVHELVEIFIVKHQGIEFIEIDKFDKQFEKRRKRGNTDEPGDDKRSPYRMAHCVATGVERILAAILGVCWKEYEEEINSL